MSYLSYSIRTRNDGLFDRESCNGVDIIFHPVSRLYHSSVVSFFCGLKAASDKLELDLNIVVFFSVCVHNPSSLVRALLAGGLIFC